MMSNVGGVRVADRHPETAMGLRGGHHPPRLWAPRGVVGLRLEKEFGFERRGALRAGLLPIFCNSACEFIVWCVSGILIPTPPMNFFFLIFSQLAENSLFFRVVFEFSCGGLRCRSWVCGVFRFLLGLVLENGGVDWFVVGVVVIIWDCEVVGNGGFSWKLVQELELGSDGNHGGDE